MKTWTIFKNKIHLVVLFLFANIICKSATYYSIGSVAPNTLTNWNTQRDGTGITPTAFNISGDVFIVQGTGGLLGAPHTMISGSTVTFGAGVTVRVETDATLQANSTITFNASANLILDSAANYKHNHTSGIASTSLQGVENFHKNSNFTFLNMPGTGPGTPANGGYGNLIINSSGSSQVNCSGNLIAIKNNLQIIQTGNSATVEFRLSGAANFTLNIGGNLEIQGGILNFSNGIGIGIINLGGNLVMSGGDIRNTNTTNPNIETINFNGNKLHNLIKTGGTITSTTSNGRTIHFNVNNGDTLNFATNILDNTATSTATFKVDAGGALQIGSSNGITTAGSIGNIQVTGTRTFSKGVTYEYNGTAAQITGSGLPDSVKGFIVNNAQGVTLTNASLTDTGILGLTNGRIKTDATHNLILSKTATIVSSINNYGDVNQGNANSFVSGPLKLETNTTNTITLPIGKDTTTGIFFAPVKITPLNNVNKIYTANYYPVPFNDLTADLNLHHVSEIENWQIECDAPLADAYTTIGLSWRPTSKLCVPSCTLADSADAWNDLVVAHYFDSGAGAKWGMDGVSPTFTMRTGSNLSYGYITTNNITGFYSPFTLGSLGNKNILPLTLISFTANLNNGIVTLNWVTSNEQQVQTFELQKSTDGINFNTIKIVQANNLITRNYYSTIDYNSNNNVAFYRVKINDQSFKNYLSKTIIVSKKNAIQVYPNPASNYITINNIAIGNSNSIKIVSNNGAEYNVILESKTNNSITLNISKLPIGYYILKVVSKNKVDNIPFIKF